MQEREQPLERGERRRRRVAVVVVQPRDLIASAYQSQKSSNVRW